MQWCEDATTPYVFKSELQALFKDALEESGIQKSVETGDSESRAPHLWLWKLRGDSSPKHGRNGPSTAGSGT